MGLEMGDDGSSKDCVNCDVLRLLKDGCWRKGVAGRGKQKVPINNTKAVFMVEVYRRRRRYRELDYFFRSILWLRICILFVCVEGRIKIEMREVMAFVMEHKLLGGGERLRYCRNGTAELGECSLRFFTSRAATKSRILQFLFFVSLSSTATALFLFTVNVLEREFARAVFRYFTFTVYKTARAYFVQVPGYASSALRSQSVQPRRWIFVDRGRDASRVTATRICEPMMLFP